ncbi:phage tail protein [Cronobacter sakazakii]
MSQTVITLAFEQWKAQQGVTGEAILLDEFVFANVPGLNPDAPISRSETLPPAAQIVHRQAVSRKGVVNENAVVHSVVLGADVGDFSFNWIGLMNKASGTLAMIVHAPVQQKLKTKAGQQGNVLTRSFLMEYNGAQAETGINTPAETWQIDFTARLAGMDERQRLENIDVFGAAAFLGDGWLVGKTGTQYFVTPGTGYVQGLRAQLAASQNITVTTKPVKVWLDVSWEGSLVSSWQVKSKVTVAANLAEYVQNGVQHYVFALASIDANGVITDLRPQGSQAGRDASDAMKKHEQSRNHPDATLNAKGFTQLSSAVDSTAENMAATPKAVRTAMENASARLAKDRNGADIPDKSLFIQNIGLQQTVNLAAGAVPSERSINGYPLSADISLKAKDVGAIPMSGSTEISGTLRTSGEVQSTNADSFRIAYGGVGAFWRNDGTNLYLMLTNKGDAFGKYNDLRPLRVGLDNGGVGIGTPLYVDNTLTVSKNVTATYSGSYAFSSQFATGAAFYESFSTGEGSEFHPVLKQKAVINNQITRAFSFGTLCQGGKTTWCLHIVDSGGNGYTHQWDVSGNYLCPGQLIPGNYGNFDARYSLKTAAVIDVRQGSPGTIVLKRNGWNYVPGGCAFTGWYVEGDAPVDDTIQYKPIQININGAWRTISG